MNKKFRRHPELKRLGNKWRKPKSRTNKVRKKLKGKKPMPSVGYGTHKMKRYRHPSGLSEIIVSKPQDLEMVDKKMQCARISKGVGNKKRVEIVKRAKEMGISILNPRVKVKKK